MTAAEVAQALEAIRAQDESPVQAVAVAIDRAWRLVDEAQAVLRGLPAEDETGESEAETEVFEAALREIGKVAVKIIGDCGFDPTVPGSMANLMHGRSK